MAEKDVPVAKRRGKHGVVLAIPLDRGEHRPARLERGELHRGCGHEARSDELEVGDSVREVGRAIHENAEPDTQREEVDHRGDHARHGGTSPHALVLREEELERAESEGEGAHRVTRSGCGR